MENKCDLIENLGFGGRCNYLMPSQCLSEYMVCNLSKGGPQIHRTSMDTSYVLTTIYPAGMVVTSLNLLPCGRLEGGRIAQAMFGRSTATLLSFATSLLLGIGGLSGSVLCLAWGLFATFFRGGEEVPAKDEITPLGDDRFAWGCVLGLICFLTLFPNGGGTFSSSFFNAPFFRGDL